MRNFIITLFICLLFVLPCLSWRSTAQSQGEGNAVQPAVFGAGVLSVGEVYRGCFAPDGRAFYFFKKVTPGREDYRIFVSHPTGGQWSEPAQMRFGGDFSDLYPALSKDGRRLVFASYRPAPGAGSSKPNAHLWMVEREGQGWGEPVWLAALNQLGHYHSWVEFGFDGALYFRRTTPDWKSTTTLRARPQGRTFLAPEPFAEVERWKNWRADVRVAGGSPGPDGKTIFLDVATRNPQTGRGASDIWVSLKQGRAWTEPRPLGGGVNAAGYDVFPFFSPDGRTLYFVRDFAAFYSLPLRAALTFGDGENSARSTQPQALPVIYDEGRFYVRPVTADGVALKLFTDTGGGLFILRDAAERLRLPLTNVATAGEEAFYLTALPAFNPMASIPLPLSREGRLPVYAPPSNEREGLAVGDGMLGQEWFAGRVWTFDYPARKLWLRAPGDLPKHKPQQRIPLGFKTDEAGKRVLNFPRLQVTIDGEQLDLLFDTGATTRLSPAALAALRDGRAAERAVSFITASVFARWRQAHPDWRVIENADQPLNEPLIEVPRVMVAGQTVGPVRFARRADKNFHEFMARFMDKRVEGALGGNALRHFRVTVDYPNAVALFER